MYIITARRMISGDVLKYLNGLRIRGGYETATLLSSPSSSDTASERIAHHKALQNQANSLKPFFF